MADLNVGISERWLSSLAGGMLALAGLERRSGGGALLTLLGAALVARGVSGHCPVLASMGASTHDYDESLLGDEEYNTVDEASDESFPASDAPSWTATTSVGSPHDNRR